MHTYIHHSYVYSCLVHDHMSDHVPNQIYVASYISSDALNILGKTGDWINRWVELRDTRLFYYKDSQVSTAVYMCTHVHAIICIVVKLYWLF